MALIIVRLKDRELQRVPVTCVATRIGRDAVNEVVIDNDGISRHHATLRYEAAEGAFVMLDASSSNGVFYRGKPMPVVRLLDGDEVQLGKFTVQFIAGGGAPLETLAPEATPDLLDDHVVRNPHPTMALRAVPRSKSSPDGMSPAFAPNANRFIRPSEGPIPLPGRSAPPERSTPAVASTPPLPLPPLKPPPGQDAWGNDVGNQARTLRIVVWSLVGVVVLLTAALAVLLRR